MQFTGLLRNKLHGSELPVVSLHPKQWNREVVIWVDESGKAGLFGSDGGSFNGSTERVIR